MPVKFTPIEEDEQVKEGTTVTESTEGTEGNFIPPISLLTEPVKSSVHFTPLDNTPEHVPVSEVNFTPLRGGASSAGGKSGISFTPLADSKQSPGQDNTFEEMSPLMKTLDVLGRPSQGLKSIVKDYGEGLRDILNNPEMSEQEKMEGMEEYTRQYSITDAFKSSLKGLTGQERTWMNDELKKLGIKNVPFLGYATELAIDPLMAAGGVGYKAITQTAGKGVKLVGQGLSKIPGVTQATEAVAAKVSPAVAALKEAFVTKTGLKKLNELIDVHLSKRQYLQGKAVGYGIKVRNVIENISKKTGRTIGEVERQVVQLIEQPGSVPKAHQESIALANTLKTHFQNILTDEMKAGVPITALSENAKGIQYFPRITSAEARQYLKQAQIGNKRVWNTKLANALERRTADFTLQEFNDFVAENGLKSLGGRSVEQFFMQSPAYATAVRGIRSAKAVTSAEFIKETGKVFGLEKAPEHWVALSDDVIKLNPSLKGLRFDPEVASEIARVTTHYINPSKLSIAGRVFNNVQNYWKKWTLAPFPKYHLRNILGNMWNNYLADVNPLYYKRAASIQMYRKYKGTGGKLEQIALAGLKNNGLTPDAANNLIKKAEELGVLGHGWYAADIDIDVLNELDKGFSRLSLGQKSKKILTGEILTEKGMAFGTTMENNARLAHFMDKSVGGKFTEAALSVKKYLFDYGDLTAFEQQVMKRIMPFYTWTRKNIPLQLENIYSQPQKYAMLAPPLRDRDTSDLLKLKYAYPQLYERLPLEMRNDVDTATFIPLEGLVPAADLAKMVRPQELFIEMVTPYLKTPVELLINKSFYNERDIQEYPAETQELLRMDIPVKLKYALTSVLPQARLLNELNKLVKKQERKEELTPAEQLMAQTLTSVYKVNLEDLKDRALGRIEAKIDDLKSGLFWAKRYKRDKEADRIKETYYKLRDVMEEIHGRPKVRRTLVEPNVRPIEMKPLPGKSSLPTRSNPQLDFNAWAIKKQKEGDDAIYSSIQKGDLRSAVRSMMIYNRSSVPQQTFERLRRFGGQFRSKFDGLSKGGRAQFLNSLTSDERSEFIKALGFSNRK